MHKHVLMFDDCGRWTAEQISGIAAKFQTDLADPDTLTVCLPPGVTVCCVEAPVTKAKEVKHGHGSK